MGIELRFVHSSQKPDQITHLSENTFLCLDLDEFGNQLEAVLEWIEHFYGQEESEMPEWIPPILPCIAVLGTAPLDTEERNRLENAGAFFIEKPPGYVHGLDNEQANEVKQTIKRLIEGQGLDKPLPKDNLIATGQEQGRDLSFLINPPYRLADDDFQRLIMDRITTPDSPLKDD